MTSVANAGEMDLEDSATYERMAEAIAFMRQHHRSQPDLKTIAQAVHLSEYHFQRVFTQWAGISPKRFLQYLTVEYAKGRIAETENLLSLTAEAGLSSPGRLHDLFVSLEAMSPGEYKAAGAGLSIRYGLHETPFGQCLIARTDRGICNLQFVEVDARSVTVEARLRDQWPAADLVWDPATTAELSDRIFQPRQSLSGH
jgi:AraC family transcriptional regulator of adaptative response/methylated-DNA-[protein]-cysteine methyltransferase